MKTSIKTELKAYLLDLINDNVLTDDNVKDWHYHAFGECYYIVGSYPANNWLKKHRILGIELASICNQYEIDNFGVNKDGKYDNIESVVNTLAYIYGGELLGKISADNVAELRQAL